MASPIPVTLTQVDVEDFPTYPAPQPLVVVGEIPGSGSGSGYSGSFSTLDELELTFQDGVLISALPL